MIYPNDTWKVMGWDILISIVLLISCITTPFDLAFAVETDSLVNYIKFRNVIDIFFLVDILINFNTAI